MRFARRRVTRQPGVVGQRSTLIGMADAAATTRRHRPRRRGDASAPGDGGVARQDDGRARLLHPLAICLCGFLSGNSPDPRLQLAGPLGSLAVLLAGYAAVFLWWFCLAVFDAGFRPRGLVLAIGGAWIVIASADRGLFGERLAQAELSWALVALGLVMVGHLAWRLLRDREGDLLDSRRRMRRAVVVALAGQLLADLAVDLFLGLIGAPRRSPSCRTPPCWRSPAGSSA